MVLLLDMTKGFWQIKLAEDSKHKTAFRTRKGLFHFLLLPFGLVNASAMFSRVVYKVFEGLPFIESYIDDCVTYATTIELMFEYLEIVMERIRKHHLKINWKKCQWFKCKVKLLGQVISNNTIEMDKEKVRILLNWPKPTNVTAIFRFRELSPYKDCYVFAKLAQPLYDLLRKDVEWGLPGIEGIYERSFNLIKARFSEFPFLRIADIERPFILKPDACKTAIGNILSQHDNSNVEYMVETDSRVLTPTERLYSIYELEMLAYIFGLTKCRQYLDGFILPV